MDVSSSEKSIEPPLVKGGGERSERGICAALQQETKAFLTDTPLEYDRCRATLMAAAAQQTNSGGAVLSTKTSANIHR